jgi:hypothetical protein
MTKCTTGCLCKELDVSVYSETVEVGMVETWFGSERKDLQLCRKYIYYLLPVGTFGAVFRKPW